MELDCLPSPKTLASVKRRAKAADLIILDSRRPGTNCGNCEYFTKSASFCEHREMLMPVKPTWCCIHWDAPGIRRVHEVPAAKSGLKICKRRNLLD